MLKVHVVVGCWLVWAAACGANPPPPIQVVERAAEVIDELNRIPARGIPAKLLTEAQAVAIVPHVIKAGFIIGGRMGHGLVLTRNAQGHWSEPTFVTLGGASLGFQAGVQATDVVLVFKKKDALDRVLAGRGKLTLGADAAVAAGPVGREAAAGTDVTLESEIYSYSRSRGLFAGVSLSGAALVADETNNARYTQGKSPELVNAIAQLTLKLHHLSQAKADPK